MRVTPGLVSSALQHSQPDVESDFELADHDLWFVCDYLGASRQQSYELLERPDQRIRNMSAPDYLLSEKPSGRRITIEPARFLNEDLQRAKARLIRKGADILIVGPEAINANLVSDALGLFLDRKLGRRQALSVEADERLLIVRNRVLATYQTFLRSSIKLPDQAQKKTDHCFLIASQRLLILW